MFILIQAKDNLKIYFEQHIKPKNTQNNFVKSFSIPSDIAYFWLDFKNTCTTSAGYVFNPLNNQNTINNTSKWNTE